MSTPTPENELAVLRATVQELTQKNATRKQQISELKQELASAQTAKQTAVANLHEIQVSLPMKTLSEAISPVPQLLLAELDRLHYEVVHTDGKLVITQNSKPVEGAEVTGEGLRKLLLTDAPEHSNFKHLLIANKASGGGAIGQERFSGFQPTGKLDKPVQSKPHFGLR